MKQPGNDGEEEAGEHGSNSLGTLLYQTNGYDDSLSKEDEQTDKHKEEDSKNTREGNPGVSLFDEIMQNIWRPI